MFLKYMNKGIEFVWTEEGKKEVKEGEVFEINEMRGEELLRLYGGLFSVVEKQGSTDGESEKKGDKKGKRKGVKVK